MDPILYQIWTEMEEDFRVLENIYGSDPRFDVDNSEQGLRVLKGLIHNLDSGNLSERHTNQIIELDGVLDTVDFTKNCASFLKRLHSTCAVLGEKSPNKILPLSTFSINQIRGEAGPFAQRPDLGSIESQLKSFLEAQLRMPQGFRYKGFDEKVEEGCLTEWNIEYMEKYTPQRRQLLW